MKKLLKILKRIFSGAYLKVVIYLQHRRLRKLFVHRTEKYVVKVVMKLPKTIYFVKKHNKEERRLRGSWKIEKLPKDEFYGSFRSLLEIL